MILVTGLLDVHVDVSDVFPDLNRETATLLDRVVSDTWSDLKAQGGYFHVPRPIMPALATLPQGYPISAGELDGTWRGMLDFFSEAMTPELPRIALTLTADDVSTYVGTLTIEHPAPAGGTKTQDLHDVSVLDDVLRFSTRPHGALGEPTRFQAVLSEDGTLQGRIEIIRPEIGMHNRGTWVASRQGS